MLWNCGKTLRYVDKKGEIHIWSLAEALVKAKGEIIERLKIISKELFSWAEFEANNGQKL